MSCSLIHDEPWKMKLLGYFETSDCIKLRATSCYTTILKVEKVSLVFAASCFPPQKFAHFFIFSKSYKVVSNCRVILQL